MAGDALGHFEQEEDGSGNMEGEEAQGKEKGDGDDGLDRFTSAVGVR